MFINEPAAQEVLDWISNENHFKELVLSPEKRLFVDPDKEVAADEFWLYYQDVVYLPGSLHVNHNGVFQTFGEPLTKDLKIRLMKNKTVITPLKGGGCSISGKRAGIPTGSTLIAFFRYSGRAVWIIAGDMVSRHSSTVIMEATAENDALLAYAFIKYLQRANAKLAEQLANSGASLSVDQQLIPDAVKSQI